MNVIIMLQIDVDLGFLLTFYIISVMAISSENIIIRNTITTLHTLEEQIILNAALIIKVSHSPIYSIIFVIF